MISELTIIIPTLNEARYLPRLLDSLMARTYAGKLEVIVVDGGSDDRTLAVAESYHNRFERFVVVQAERGVGHQRNVGAARAQYAYLAFIDADIMVPSQLFQELMDRIDTSRPFIAGVWHRPDHGTWKDQPFIWIVHGLVALAHAAHIPATIGDFIVTTRAQHELIHGFAEGTVLGEDIDYGIRSVKAGARYDFFWKLEVIASDRRVRSMGRFKLLWTWSRAYLHVIRRGPIRPGEGYEYPFGHYDKH